MPCVVLRMLCFLIAFIREFCVLWNSSVLLLEDEKDTATLHATINSKRSDGKWRKNRELFSLEVNLQ